VSENVLHTVAAFHCVAVGKAMGGEVQVLLALYIYIVDHNKYKYGVILRVAFMVNAEFAAT
jgi:hypothetical protein